MKHLETTISSKIENAFSNWEFYPFDIEDYENIVYYIEYAIRTIIRDNIEVNLYD